MNVYCFTSVCSDGGSDYEFDESYDSLHLHENLTETGIFVIDFFCLSDVFVIYKRCLLKLTGHICR